jgi:hypothetical protein
MQRRIQEKRGRFDDRPVSAPNVHSFSGSPVGLLPCQSMSLTPKA